MDYYSILDYRRGYFEDSQRIKDEDSKRIKDEDSKRVKDEFEQRIKRHSTRCPTTNMECEKHNVPTDVENQMKALVASAKEVEERLSHSEERVRVMQSYADDLENKKSGLQHKADSLEKQLKEEQLKCKALIELSRHLETANEQLSKELATKKTTTADFEIKMSMLAKFDNNTYKKYNEYPELYKELQEELEAMKADNEVISEQLKEVSLTHQQTKEQYEKLSEQIFAMRAELLKLQQQKSAETVMLMFAGVFLCSLGAVIVSKHL